MFKQSRTLLIKIRGWVAEISNMNTAPLDITYKLTYNHMFQQSKTIHNQKRVAG